VPARKSPSRLKAEELQLLKVIAYAGGGHSKVSMTSREAGEKVGASQQAADRYLMRLAKEGYLTRSLSSRRQELTLSPSAIEVLRREYHGYQRIFEGPARLRIRGTVVSGLGEGRYYLSQPGYVLQFSERLGYSPYPGTLNVRVSPEDLLKVAAVKDWNGIRIDGFEASGRTFGGATCLAARLNGRESHLIIPDRSHHKDMIEFIAPVYLRDTLHLKDSDPIEVELLEA
jgi:riboflavin kinase